MTRRCERPYDAEVEYLECSAQGGYSCIKPDYFFSGKDIDIHCEFEFLGFGNPALSNSTIYTNWASSSLNYYSFQKSNNTDYFVVCHGSLITTQVGSIASLTNKKINLSVYGATRKYKLNELEGTIRAYDSNDSTSAIIIGGMTSTNYTYFKLYSFRIDKAGVTELDLIPVRVGAEGFMYDRVSGRLFGNAGTGRFIVGPDVA